MKSLNTEALTPFRIQQAQEAFDEGDVTTFILSAASNQSALALVFDNIDQLKERGIFEPALLEAFTGCRTNHHGWDPRTINALFDLADRDKLRAAGDPLPGPGPFTLYRGVAGSGTARRPDGLSWTTDLDEACWFALRFENLASPSVLVTEVQAEKVLAYCNQRNEGEMLIRPDKSHRLKITLREMRRRKDAAEAEHA